MMPTWYNWSNEKWPGDALTSPTVTQRRVIPMSTDHYTCTKCGAVKTAEGFPSNGRGGRARRCKSCNIVATAAWALLNKDRKRANDRDYYSRNKDRWPPWRDQRDKDPAGYRTRARERARRYYASEKGQLQKRSYFERNRDRWRQYKIARRALEAAAIGRADADAILARWEYYGGLCWMCGAQATAIDHVIALSAGGTGWPANLRPACKPCNSSKGARGWRLVMAQRGVA